MTTALVNVIDLMNKLFLLCIKMVQDNNTDSQKSQSPPTA